MDYYIKKDEKFNRLTALEDANVSRDKILFRCDCGNEKRIRADNLKNERTKSCGCLKIEKATKHSLSNHPLYRVWYDMKNRCYNKKHPQYKDYAGRGIFVCEKYLEEEGLKTFIKDSIELGWKPGLQPDRVDNDAIYKYDNIRYVTSSENNRNKRNNIFLTAFGENKLMVEWSEDERCVVSYGCLYNRINKLKWESERAITTPSQKKENGQCKMT